MEYKDCFNQDPHCLAGQQKQNKFSKNAKIIDYFVSARPILIYSFIRKLTQSFTQS